MDRQEIIDEVARLARKYRADDQDSAAQFTAGVLFAMCGALTEGTESKLYDTIEPFVIESRDLIAATRANQ